MREVTGIEPRSNAMCATVTLSPLHQGFCGRVTRSGRRRSNTGLGRGLDRWSPVSLQAGDEYGSPVLCAHGGSEHNHSIMHLEHHVLEMKVCQYNYIVFCVYGTINQAIMMANRVFFMAVCRALGLSDDDD